MLDHLVSTVDQNAECGSLVFLCWRGSLRLLSVSTLNRFNPYSRLLAFCVWTNLNIKKIFNIKSSLFKQQLSFKSMCLLGVTVSQHHVQFTVIIFNSFSIISVLGPWFFSIWRTEIYGDVQRCHFMDLTCQIHGKKPAAWFVMKLLNSLSTLCLLMGSASGHAAIKGTSPHAQQGAVKIALILA